MEAIKKQASKLREQVAKQQLLVLRHLQNLGNHPLLDDTEIECHQHLQNLYNSTRTAKHFQRDIVRSVDGFISISKKQMEIVRKLAEDCCKYGSENECPDSPLAMAAMHFGTSHRSVEDEREVMLRILGDQVSAPLRASIAGAPLEDARYLTHRYDRLRQEVEVQASEVLRRQSRYKDPSEQSIVKLKNAETGLSELKSAMMVLGREATSAMLSVEDQQQKITFQKLITLVEAERSYHQKVVVLLEKLHEEMVSEKQLGKPTSQSVDMQQDALIPPSQVDTSNKSTGVVHKNPNGLCFVAKVIHSFDAQSDGELSLEMDDYVVVSQVDPNGWSEGECRGKAGWFPSAYIERQDQVPKSIIEEKS